MPSLNEIKEVVFDLDPYSAPGLDGFTDLFFRHCWNIMGRQVCEAVRSFFISGTLISGMNASIMTLIPKSNNASQVENFLPNVLSNFIYKIITRIILDRMSIVVMDVIAAP